MTYDPKIYALAEALLTITGDTNTVAIHRLSERLQDAYQDFLADLDNEDKEREARDESST